MRVRAMVGHCGLSSQTKDLRLKREHTGSSRDCPEPRLQGPQEQNSRRQLAMTSESKKFQPKAPRGHGPDQSLVWPIETESR